jgi:hypothetical protein
LVQNTLSGNRLDRIKLLPPEHKGKVLGFKYYGWTGQPGRQRFAMVLRQKPFARFRSLARFPEGAGCSADLLIF